jgi:hypothetical protein
VEPGSPSSLSSLARPFVPAGRSKVQRWAEASPVSLETVPADVSSEVAGPPVRRSIKEVALLPPPRVVRPVPRWEPHCPVIKVVARPLSPRRAPRPSPDAEGWVEVRPRRHLRGPLPPRRSIPQDLRGRCFNCMAISHKAAECRCPVRCFACRSLGHRAASCPARLDRAPLCRNSTSVWDRLGQLLVDAKPRSVKIWREVPSRGGMVEGAGAPVQAQGGAKRRRHRTRGRRSNPSLLVPEPSVQDLQASMPAEDQAPLLSQVEDDASAPRGCVLERSVALDREEFRLQRCALFVVVTGSRPQVTLEVFAAEVAAGFGLNEGSFSVHRSSPEDFVLVLDSEHAANEVYNNGSVFNSPSGSFKFIRWSRLAHAEVVSFPSLVMVEFGGIPVHAWELATAQNLMRDFCSEVELHPDSVNRLNFSSFKVFGWCRRPQLISVSFELLIPERVMSSGGPPAVRRLLSYPVTASVSSVPQADATVSPSLPSSPTSDDGAREAGSRRRRLLRGVLERLGASASVGPQSGRRPVHERLGHIPTLGRHVDSSQGPLHGGVHGGGGSFPATARVGQEEHGLGNIDGVGFFRGDVLLPEVVAAVGIRPLDVGGPDVVSPSGGGRLGLWRPAHCFWGCRCPSAVCRCFFFCCGGHRPDP